MESEWKSDEKTRLTLLFQLQRLHRLLGLFTFGTPTVVKVSNLGAIKQVLGQGLVDLIVYVTCPRCSRRPRVNLGWKFGQKLLKM